MVKNDAKSEQRYLNKNVDSLVFICIKGVSRIKHEANVLVSEIRIIHTKN